jgi:hypothetical protein
MCTANGECSNPEERRKAQSARRHDGFYARLELGIGYFSGARFTIPFDAELKGDVTGVAQVGALMFGGTVAPGLVLGGGAWGTNVPSANYSGDVEEPQSVGPEVVVHRSVSIGFASVSIIGPFLAWYPDPTRGLSGQLGIGYALASLESDRTGSVVQYQDVGWGAELGAGYDFWIGEQWSLGLLGRVSYAAIGVRDATDTLSAWVPAVAFGATYH